MSIKTKDLDEQFHIVDMILIVRADGIYLIGSVDAWIGCNLTA